MRRPPAPQELPVQLLVQVIGTIDYPPSPETGQFIGGRFTSVYYSDESGEGAMLLPAGAFGGADPAVGSRWQLAMDAFRQIPWTPFPLLRLTRFPDEVATRSGLEVEDAQAQRHHGAGTA